MKHFAFLLFIILISACGGAKNSIENSTKKEQPEIIESKKFDTIDTAEVLIPEIETKIITTKKQVILETLKQEIIVTTTEAFNHNLWNTLLIKYVSKKGNVNYKGFKNDRKTLTNYIVSLGENMPNTTWTKEDKLAYWINAYNAMTVDLILRNYPIKSIKNINKPWEQRLWKLGKKWYNLDEIEHKILRKMNEPRIHFSIVCASYSCPKLQNEAFIASNMELQLTKATKEFLNDSKRNSISENSIQLSKIFKWFANDFKTEGSAIDFINRYSETKIKNNAKKSFKDYNWALNE